MARAKKRTYPHADAATQYARDVVSGDIPACLYVRLAARRHLDDLEKQNDPAFPYYWDPEKCDDYCAFAELMRHTKGEWAGKPIRLEPWQKFTMGVPFGWMRRSDNTRRYREIYVEIPRKNGKSLVGAVTGNYMLTADNEPGAEVYSGASKEKQAWEVFGPARLMAKRNEQYQEAFGLLIGAKNISIPATGSKFEPVVGNPGDGSSPHCAIVDEFHEHNGPELYDTMKTGMGARRQPMLVVITTAGSDTSGPCYAKRNEAIKVLEGLLDNPVLWAVIYTLDKDDDWTDFSLWGKANPNLGVSTYEDSLRVQYRDAMQRADRQNIVKCKHLNIWSNAAISWVNMPKWDACADTSLTLEQFKGCQCWAGVDLASKVDLTAMMFLFRIPATHAFARFVKSDYVLFGKYYLPEETVERPENAHYRQWRDTGLLTATPGARTDYGYLEDDLKAAAAAYSIQELAYDAREAEYLMQQIRTWASFECVEVPQSPAHISEPMKEFEALYLTGKIRHNGCPLLRWQISNVVLRNSRNKSFYPAKERDENKIDGPVAAIMALSRAMAVKPESPPGGIFDWSQLTEGRA